MNKSKISSLAELDEAQKQVSRQLASKKRSISGNFEKAKSFYAPSNMISTAVGDFIPVLDWRGLALRLISEIRKKL